MQKRALRRRAMFIVVIEGSNADWFGIKLNWMMIFCFQSVMP